MNTDSYATAATSWGIFAALVLGGCYYYLPRPQQRLDAARGKRRSDLDISQSQSSKEKAQGPKPGSSVGRSKGNATTTKRQTAPKQHELPQPTLVIADVEEQREEDDISNKQFAERMAQAQKGANIGSNNKQEKRVRTVKQNNAHDTPMASASSSQAGTDANDEQSPAVMSLADAGGVTDMLEPAAPGPSAMRITAPSKPQKEKTIRQAKEEVVETKKQRQNRKKVEERKVQREAEERERKNLEEKQRRAAREGRGEPAKNGMQSTGVPTSSVWQAPASTDAAPTPRTINGLQNAPLLDTFDAESVSSSNGGLEASTTATSTTSAGGAPVEHSMQFQDDDTAHALKISEDESAWTTVGETKKQKKKPTGDGSVATSAQPVLTTNPNGVKKQSASTWSAKPKGFQALNVEYEQRADVADPDDASNWDA